MPFLLIRRQNHKLAQTHTYLLRKTIKRIQRRIPHKMVRRNIRISPASFLVPSANKGKQGTGQSGLLRKQGTTREKKQEGRRKDVSQNYKFPCVLFFPDVRSTFYVKKDEQLHPPMVLPESRRIPCRLLHSWSVRANVNPHLLKEHGRTWYTSKSTISSSSGPYTCCGIDLGFREFAILLADREYEWISVPYGLNAVASSSTRFRNSVSVL